MYLVKVIPFSRTVKKQELSYFSTDKIPVGSIVNVSLRNKKILALVINTLEASTEKSNIKDLDFSLKKITKDSIDNRNAFPSWLIESIKKIALLSGTSPGAVIASILPKDSPRLLKQREEIKNKSGFEILAIQANKEDRHDMLRGSIRSMFAKKKSVAVICPTEDSVFDTAESLSKGINEYSFVFDLKNENSIKKSIQKTESVNHPILVFGTAKILPFIKEDTGLIIFEEEYSRFYKEQKSPYLDMRLIGEEISKNKGVTMILGDSLLRVETLARIESGEIGEYSRISQRDPYKIQSLVVDIQKEREEKGFSVIGKDLVEMVSFAEKKNKKIFLFALRKGISPETLCKDCGTIVLCEKCDSAVTLHKTQSMFEFICHHCGESRSAKEVCKKCGSWNLESYGIGTEKVESELSKITEMPILRIDSDTISGEKEAKKKIKDFIKKENGIMIGTELALRAIPDSSVDYSGIVSFDALFSIPDFRANERIMHVILDVKRKATECFIIQARNAKNILIEQGVTGDLKDFTKNEIEAREKFKYPPFGNLIKISVMGKRSVIESEVNNIIKIINKYDPVVFPNLIKTKKGLAIAHILIKVSRNDWPNKELREIIESLPPNVVVNVNPERLI